MNRLPTLRRELILAFGVVFAGALLVAVVGISLMLPRFQSPYVASAYVLLLLIGDVAIFTIFGRSLVQARVLAPVDSMIEGAEAIAAGQYDVRIPEPESQEMHRLSDALNHMAERLLKDQHQLAENVRSLDETNKLLLEARDAMVRAEKLASAGRLAAGIAHEIGNPLGAIIGYLGLIGRRASDSDRELIEAAEREARRIDRIVRGLLDFSRPHEAHTAPIDINVVVQETVDLVVMQGRLAGVELNLDLQPGLPQVSGDPYQLQQVLVNLLMNAADAMGGQKDARVTVTTRTRKAQPKRTIEQARRKDDPPTVNYAHRRRLWATPAQADPGPVGSEIVEIVVADNGSGIPADLLGTIFEPFVTTKEPGKGTGLGLAVCARLIDGMGGVIRADSPDSGGARFSIVLPRAVAIPHSTGS